MSKFQSIGYQAPHGISKMVDKLIALDSDNFNVISDVLNLRSELDFVGVDLSYVDFSGSDLRRHDLSYANLTGTIGFGIRVDETTNLQNAIIDHSILRPIANRRRAIERYRLSDEIGRVNKMRWDQQIVYFDHNMHNPEKLKHLAVIAQAVFISSYDKAVHQKLLKTIERLIGLRRSIDFIKSVLATEPGYDIITSSLRFYLSKISSHPEKKKTMLHMAQIAESEVKEFILSLLLEYIHNTDDIRTMASYFYGTKSKSLREEFMRQCAIVMGPEYEMLVCDQLTNEIMDFLQPINSDMLLILARRNMNARYHINDLTSIDDHVSQVIYKLHRMKEAGIPIHIVI